MSQPIQSLDDTPSSLSIDADDSIRTFIDVIYTPDSEMQNDSPFNGPTRRLSIKDLRHCGLLTTAIEGDKQAKYIPIPQSSMTEYAFDRVMEYLKHHSDREIEYPPRPLKSTDLSKAWSDPWDVNFIEAAYKTEDNERNIHNLFKITLAANYVDCKPLLHLVSTKIAALIKGKHFDEVKKILGGEA